MAANMTNDLLKMIWILCFHRWQRTFHFFFIEIENFRGEGKMLMRHTHDTTFSENILDFYKILEESEQFFITDNDQSSQVRQTSIICFRLIGYDTKHLEYF
jgi:hypothetical protein